jgi:lipoate-protein ligase A
MARLWRLILDKGYDGYYNMACDEAIFNWYPKKGVPTLRIYEWERPFITLGYFQEPRYVLNLDACQNEGISFTRRLTGGAAIIHFEEITYSLTLSCQDLNLSKSIKESYKILTSFIINFYKNLGLKGSFAQSILNDGLGEYKNFCFSSWEYFDILIQGKKIGGNAQRRKRALIFQQGSIPLRINFDLVKRLIKGTPPDLEAKTQGLFYFLGKKIESQQLKRILSVSFQKTFGVDLIYSNLDDEEREDLDHLMKNKYASKIWNYSDAQAHLVR